VVESMKKALSSKPTQKKKEEREGERERKG
jgi:hypothetical protein